MSATTGKQVVIVADDLGKSSSVNRAVAQAHEKGILTAASIMAGGDAFEGAALIAATYPALSAGVHITLCDGRSVLPHSRIPGLVNREGVFERDPAKAGLRYTQPGLSSQIEAEVKAQFDRLEKAGVHPSHVDGHHHLHMHPRIFGIVCREAAKREISWIRIPHEPLGAVYSLHSQSRKFLSYFEWGTFGLLGIFNRKTAQRWGLHALPFTFGLSQTGEINEQSLIKVISRMRGPAAEIFFHPDTASESGKRELNALMSPRVRSFLRSANVELSGFRGVQADLPSTSAWGII